jgi:hypothetical protein
MREYCLYHQGIGDLNLLLLLSWWPDFNFQGYLNRKIKCKSCWTQGILSCSCDTFEVKVSLRELGCEGAD